MTSGVKLTLAGMAAALKSVPQYELVLDERQAEDIEVSMQAGPRWDRLVAQAGPMRPGFPGGLRNWVACSRRRVSRGA